MQARRGFVMHISVESWQGDQNPLACLYLRQLDRVRLGNLPDAVFRFGQSRPGLLMARLLLRCGEPMAR